MAKKTINKIEHETWYIISGSNQTFTITERGGIVDIEQPNETAIGLWLDDAVSGADLVVDGDISAFGGESVGLYIAGANTDVDIGRKSLVTAFQGVYAEGAGSVIDNDGKIHAVDTGIIANGAKSILNDGTIFADKGIDNWAILDLKVVNTGVISAVGQVVTDLGGEMLLINKGGLYGEVDLGGGDDVFVNKGGKTTAMILGGEGDDTFRVDGDEIFVYENDNEGTDTIVTSRNFESHEMGEIENFRISGKKNISLEANGYGNFISGNSGNNIIDGQEGGDVIAGGRGRDRIIGGSEGDVFVFAKGDGRDVIADFTDGEDFIQFEADTGISGAGDLTITDTADGMLIRYGKGDTVLLEGVHGITLNDDDFLI
jgi:hypothetical protein